MILQEEPHITVGIQHGKSVDFRLCGVFTTPEGRLFPPGEYRVDISTGKRGFVLGTEYYEDLRLVPLSSETLFDLPHVTIGIDFHWQRQECQTFCGILHLVCDREEIYAINEVPVEDYLTSVISSEMSATSSLELLKAHAVVSRSCWRNCLVLAGVEYVREESAEMRIRPGRLSDGMIEMIICFSMFVPTITASVIKV